MSHKTRVFAELRRLVNAELLLGILHEVPRQNPSILAYCSAVHPMDLQGCTSQGLRPGIATPCIRYRHPAEAGGHCQDGARH